MSFLSTIMNIEREWLNRTERLVGAEIRPKHIETDRKAIVQYNILNFFQLYR